MIETEDWKNRSLSVFRLPTLNPTYKIEGNFTDVRVSPDKKKFAALVRVKEAVAPKDSKSHYMLGEACRLKVYNARHRGINF
jgi:hypothetical protein